MKVVSIRKDMDSAIVEAFDKFLQMEEFGQKLGNHDEPAGNCAHGWICIDVNTISGLHTDINNEFHNADLFGMMREFGKWPNYIGGSDHTCVIAYVFPTKVEGNYYIFFKGIEDTVKEFTDMILKAGLKFIKESL